MKILNNIITNVMQNAAQRSAGVKQDNRFNKIADAVFAGLSKSYRENRESLKNIMWEDKKTIDDLRKDLCEILGVDSVTDDQISRAAKMICAYDSEYIIETNSDIKYLKDKLQNSLKDEKAEPQLYKKPQLDPTNPIVLQRIKNDEVERELLKNMFISPNPHEVQLSGKEKALYQRIKDATEEKIKNSCSIKQAITKRVNNFIDNIKQEVAIRVNDFIRSVAQKSAYQFTGNSINNSRFDRLADQFLTKHSKEYREKKLDLINRTWKHMDRATDIKKDLEYVKKELYPEGTLIPADKISSDEVAYFAKTLSLFMEQDSSENFDLGLAYGQRGLMRHNFHAENSDLHVLKLSNGKVKDFIAKLDPRNWFASKIPQGYVGYNSAIEVKEEDKFLSSGYSEVEYYQKNRTPQTRKDLSQIEPEKGYENPLYNPLNVETKVEKEKEKEKEVEKEKEKGSEREILFDTNEYLLGSCKPGSFTKMTPFQERLKK